MDAATHRIHNLQSRPRVAILCYGNANRFEPLAKTLAAAGMQPLDVIYHDDFCTDAGTKLTAVDAVLVWVNPIEDGHDRSRLDGMLREVAAKGVFVSAHPDVILKLGTKQVLYDTREMSWGCDTRLYRNLDELEQVLYELMEKGEVRVLKQYRGNGGNGVWKVSRAPGGSPPEICVRARHALRGSIEEVFSLKDFLGKMQNYFADGGRIIDQPYQERLIEGMVRCYLVHDRVVGFGVQSINALYPAPLGAPPEAAPLPTPRIYHPATLESYQPLKQKLEEEWVPQLEQLLDIHTTTLPIIWDCDFLLGPKDAKGNDTYVLCEINVSSVSPFPESALEPMAAAIVTQIMRNH